MNDKLVLNNGTEVEIQPGSSLSDIRVVSQTKTDMVNTWDLFTNENLKTVKIKNGDNVEVGTYTNILLENETSSIQKDETILTSFNLREKTEVELLRERVEQLESTTTVLDGAVGDLGEAVSGLAEEGGLA